MWLSVLYMTAITPVILEFESNELTEINIGCLMITRQVRVCNTNEPQCQQA